MDEARRREFVERVSGRAVEFLGMVRGMGGVTLGLMRLAVELAIHEDFTIYGIPGAPEPTGILHCGQSRRKR